MNENRKRLSNGFWVGILLLMLGSFLLLDRMDMVEFPRWLFPWGILVAAGLVVGINRKFQGVGWLIMILVGAFFMLDRIPGFPWDLDDYGIPVIVIILGLFILSRAVMGGASREKKEYWRSRQQGGLIASDEGGEDYFDIVAVFGGAKRKVFSKNFKGGEATCIFGGVDIDLSQADISGTVVIDATQIFGGIKLLVPANWELKSDAVAIFGSVEDKRMVSQAYAGDKKLLITGFVLFGGIDIKSF